MATQPEKGFQVVQTETDAPGMILSLPEGDSEDGKKGEPVLYTAGFITKRAAVTEEILGILQDDMSNSATAEADGTRVRLLLLSSNLYFTASLSGVSAAADRGASFGIVESGVADVWHVNRSDTTDKIVNIVDILGTIGDTNTLVKVKFLSIHMQADLEI